MPSDEWIKALPDGRRVKFTYQELPDDGRFITAQVEGNKVVYSIVLTDTKEQKTRLVVEKLKVSSRASFQRSSNPARTPSACATATFDNRRGEA